MGNAGTCAHGSAITKILLPKRRECEVCVQIGATWVHLRTCQECGKTLCCDGSHNKHETKHTRANGQPVLAAAEPGEPRLYCYPHTVCAEY